VAWLSFIFIHDVTSLITLQAILGLGEALGTPAFEAIFAEHLDARHHIREYSDWQVIFNLCVAIGTVAGGLLVNQFGFPVLFITMASLATISFMIVALKPHHIDIC
jgi:MFS family permease